MKTMQAIYTGAVEIATGRVTATFEATHDAELCLGERMARLQRTLEYIADRQASSKRVPVRREYRFLLSARTGLGGVGTIGKPQEG